MEKVYELLLLFSSYLILGLINVFMPYFTRRTESFGVSIPEEVFEEEILKDLRKRYVIISSVIVLLITVIFSYLYFSGPPEMGMRYFTIGMIILILSLFAVYLKFHFQMKKIKSEKKWYEGKVQTIVMDINFRNEKLTYSNLWFLIPFMATVVMAILIYINYDIIPEQIPTHFDFKGNVTTWKEKSYLNVYWPTLTQLFMIGMFIFVNSIIGKAKQQISASNPEKSIEQNKIFRKRWSLFTIIMGSGTVLLFAFVQLTFIYQISPKIMTAVIGVFTLVAILGSVYLSITTGQGGSRIKVIKGINGQEIDRDDDKYWKLGQFYFNPEDPAVFIEKRFGIGWTMNFARLKGWLYILLLVVVTMFFAYMF